MKQYIVRLSDEARKELEALVNTGKAAAHKIKLANVLVAGKADGPVIGLLLLLYVFGIGKAALMPLDRKRVV